MKRKKHSNFLIVFLILFAILILFFAFDNADTANDAIYNVNLNDDVKYFYLSSNDTVEEQFRDNIYDQLDQLDTSLFDGFLTSLDNDVYIIFGNVSFSEALKGILNGEFSTDASSIFTAIFNLFLSGFINIAPILITIGMIAILCGTLSNLRSKNTLGKNSGEMVHYVCYMAIVLTIMTALLQIINLTTKIINNMRTFMAIIFPVILTLITASGGTASGQLFQPLTAILTGGITEIIVGIVVPIFIVITILSVVSNLSNNIKLNKLADFFKNAGQWLMGICFTVFIAFLSIQGILAGTMDGVSIRAAKYAIGHSIPIVGNYIKDGFDLVLGSCVLIKNAAGVTGMLLLIAMVLAPIIQILVFSLALKLTAGIVEPVTDKRISTLIQSVSKNITLLLVAIISIAFMFFITLAVLVMSSNSVLT